MKNIIYKEIKLVIQPAVFLFTLLTALLLIPNYPYAVGMLYFIIGIQIIFQVARANRDLEFTTMLPIPRNAVVISKHFSVMFLQILQIIVAIPFALISSLIINTAGNSVGLDANFTFFGVTLIGYSAFNIMFLPAFYKSGYKIGIPILLGILFYGLTITVFELIISLIPALKENLDNLDPSTFIYQIFFLIAGIIIYFSVLFCSYKLSVKNFEKVNL